MAVGKTTAVRYLQVNAPYINISYEINTDIVDEVKRRNLDKNKYEDYLEIQKLWLGKEVVRYEKAKAHLCSVMDFGRNRVLYFELSEEHRRGLGSRKCPEEGTECSSWVHAGQNPFLGCFG